MSRPRLAPAAAPLPLCFWQLRVLPKYSPLWRSYQRLARAKLRTEHPDLTDAERHEIMVVWSRRDCHLYRSPALNKLLGSKTETGHCVARSLYRRGFSASGRAIPRRSRWLRRSAFLTLKTALGITRWQPLALGFSHVVPPYPSAMNQCARAPLLLTPLRL